MKTGALSFTFVTFTVIVDVLESEPSVTVYMNLSSPLKFVFGV